MSEVSPPVRPALVVSDVDGTLVASDKSLRPATREAVARLREAGIGFTIVSSRPPIGLRGLAEALRIDLPMGAFNGATMIGPDLAVLSETRLPAEVAREAAERLVGEGLDIWVFAEGVWALRDPRAAYTDLERRTLGAEPVVRADLSELVAKASKIVGVGADPYHLAACETRLAAALAGRADVHRSQAYYLDVTPAGIGKGAFVDAIGRRLGLPREAIAVIGDAGNDRPMFARAGLSIAMGNAEDAVKREADRVTADTDSDGFAKAMAAFVLGPPGS